METFMPIYNKRGHAVFVKPIEDNFKRRYPNVGNSNDIWICDEKHYVKKLYSSDKGDNPIERIRIKPGQPLSKYARRFRPGDYYANNTVKGVIRYKGPKAIMSYSNDHDQIIYEAWNTVDSSDMDRKDVVKSLKQMILHNKIVQHFNRMFHRAYEIEIDMDIVNYLVESRFVNVLGTKEKAPIKSA